MRNRGRIQAEMRPKCGPKSLPLVMKAECTSSLNAAQMTQMTNSQESGKTRRKRGNQPGARGGRTKRKLLGSLRDASGQSKLSVAAGVGVQVQTVEQWENPNVASKKGIKRKNLEKYLLLVQAGFTVEDFENKSTDQLERMHTECLNQLESGEICSDILGFARRICSNPDLQLAEMIKLDTILSGNIAHGMTRQQRDALIHLLATRASALESQSMYRPAIYCANSIAGLSALNGHFGKELEYRVASMTFAHRVKMPTQARTQINDIEKMLDKHAFGPYEWGLFIERIGCILHEWKYYDDALPYIEIAIEFFKIEERRRPEWEHEKKVKAAQRRCYCQRRRANLIQKKDPQQALTLLERTEPEFDDLNDSQGVTLCLLNRGGIALASEDEKEIERAIGNYQDEEYKTHIENAVVYTQLEGNVMESILRKHRKDNSPEVNELLEKPLEAMLNGQWWVPDSERLAGKKSLRPDILRSGAEDNVEINDYLLKLPKFCLDMKQLKRLRKRAEESLRE